MEQIEIPKIVDDWKPEGARTTEEFTVTLPGGSTFTNVPSKDPFIAGDPRIGTMPRNAQQTLLGLPEVFGDPNSTEPHTDTIKTVLLFKMESVIATPEEKDAARALFAQLYPHDTLKPKGEPQDHE